ncbi:disulfide bond formation protein B [Colwellia ponticola]|uniref:Disulfide bond formation protein B n=1 Tax=Colwellia ponticola TaxID=2304625 RepID=A0A8H2JMA4_9GAMM|nr:disulfide bond formation protein B [Colwellia ponticola]TMM44048.1 disulfide bond formation protein B [Colwellia ponticola]
MKAALNESNSSWYLLFLVWIIATSGTLISLFFSEIVQVPVCVLCWYQRIALYPLVIIVPLALFPFDITAIRYISPLVILGWLFALFHVLIVLDIIPEAAQPCVLGVPCSETHINLWGFLNIPLMSLLTFSVIALLLFLTKKSFANTINKTESKR